MTGELVWIDHDRLDELSPNRLERIRQKINGLVSDKVLTNPEVVSQMTADADGNTRASNSIPEGTYLIVRLSGPEPPKLEVVE